MSDLEAFLASIVDQDHQGNPLDLESLKQVLKKHDLVCVEDILSLSEADWIHVLGPKWSLGKRKTLLRLIWTKKKQIGGIYQAGDAPDQLSLPHQSFTGVFYGNSNMYIHNNICFGLV